jgi:hypothetical protein
MMTREPGESDSAVRWSSVYAGVAVFTVVVVLLLYLFSYWFAG